jgi:glutamate racemase
LIKKEINAYYGGKMTILDSSEVVAQALQKYLAAQDLLNKANSAEHHFLVSDFTESFESSARMFFHESVKLEKHSLWN